MNVAILTAGGVGSRFGQDVPKQFLSVNLHNGKISKSS